MRLPIMITMLLTATAVVAQTPAPTPEQVAKAREGAAKMAAADANKDGKWDKAEWAAAGRKPMGFGYADTNKDGFVSTDELKAAAAKRAG
jgi:hypothetical protein